MALLRFTQGSKPFLAASHRAADLFQDSNKGLLLLLAAGTLKQLPSLGHTPGGERPAPCNLNNLMSWLQSIPLAASAAQDPYRPAGSLLRVPGKMEVL